MRAWLLLGAFILGGCADSVQIDAAALGRPLPCHLSNRNGAWDVVAPAKVSVGANSGTTHVVCRLDGEAWALDVTPEMKTNTWHKAVDQ